MTREEEFLIFCLEIYKNKKSLTGKEVMKLFKEYNVIDYVKNYFEALHTTGSNYIIEDIDLYIKARQSK